MSLPPFPEQDLAKLVLGYLAEQQFMTIYDEFLEASPYLDAVTNEYDRIFMTSLKTILAEYRAVKIYLETCKPFSLRKKLSQCTNLVDVIKFLIRHLDTQKLCAHDSRNQTRSSLESATTQLKSAICVLCKSVKPGFCKCSNLTVRDNDLELETLGAQTELSVSHVSRTYGRNSKGITGDNYNLAAVSQDITYEGDNTVHTCILPATVAFETGTSSKNYTETSVANDQHLYDTPVNLLGITESTQNYNMNIVNTTSNNVVNRLDRETETFQEFAASVPVNNNYNSTVTPNACSSNARRPISCYMSDYPRDNYSTKTCIMPTNAAGKTHMLRESTVEKINISSNIVNDVSNKKLDAINAEPKEIRESCMTAKHSGQTMSDEHKVTILSNIRLEQSSLSNERSNTIFKSNISKNHCKVTPALKRVDSTTTLHTIYVNGTPAYKPNIEKIEQYTKDEIMAMPTIILISGVPQNTSSATITNTTPAINTTESLSTLTIPVTVDDSIQSANSQAKKPVVTESTDVEFNTEIETETNSNKIGTTVGTDIDVIGTSKSDTKNVIVGVLGKTSTPRVPCQTRKSSSTPRRTSHIRVLDFTTPCQVPDTESASLKNSPAITDIRMRDLPILETIDEQETDTLTAKKKTATVKDKTLLKSCIDKDIKENIINKTQFPAKPYNWDAQLRALAVSNESQDNTTPKPKPKSVKKKKPQEKEPDKNKNTPKEICNKVTQKKSSTRKSKTQISKNNKIISEVTDDSTGNKTEVVEVPIKPTINVITDWKTAPTTVEKPDNSNSTNQETPEMDRVSLQNAFGAKLNISDLLETPYKQALYDIQMETPRFLGPDLPGEPISDVKIMNIPTPRFLSTPGFAVTPKPPQATPSSYASRPTDYSSGGSYYKPDDQDYARIIDDLENPSISPAQDMPRTKDLPTTKMESNTSETCKINAKSLRPIRRCTKNVSYYDSPNVNVKKKASSETLSSCSDLSCSTNCSCDTSDDKKDKPSVTSKKQTTGVQAHKTKLEPVKKRHVAMPTKKKSPVKKAAVSNTSSFVKIKPRRPTPKKDSKSIKRTSGLIQKESTKNKSRKKTTSKDKLTNTLTPQLASVPTKSRRKSSTPRKIHCTKELNSDGPSISPDTASNTVVVKNVLEKPSHNGTEDTDIPHLHWSDDCSRDSKPAEVHTDMEDINKIKEYISNTEGNKNVEQTIGSEKCSNVSECLHIDLVKRGFDIETAKSIERDLLDTSPQTKSSKKEEGLKIAVLPDTIDEVVVSNTDVIKVIEIKKSEPLNVVDTQLNESEASLRIDEVDEESDQEIDFTVCESNQESTNYFEIEHEANRTESSGLPAKLKDTYCMEVCIDDGVTVRLKATPLIILLESTEACPDKHNDTFENIDIAETENAVKSIADIDKLYTPLKDPTSSQDQCVEIFDSTLSSLNTPLKESADEKPTENPEVTLEVEPVAEITSKSGGTKKRKRNQSESDDALNESKKNKPDSQCMATNLANSIQDLDIDSILYRLHGP